MGSKQAEWANNLFMLISSYFRHKQKNTKQIINSSSVPWVKATFSLQQKLQCHKHIYLLGWRGRAPVQVTVGSAMEDGAGRSSTSASDAFVAVHQTEERGEFLQCECFLATANTSAYWGIYIALHGRHCPAHHTWHCLALLHKRCLQCKSKWGGKLTHILLVILFTCPTND